MKIIGVTVVGNEKPIVKYVMPYIKYIGYDKLYIYDDSDDGTIDMIKSYNFDFIEYRDFTYERGVINSWENTRLCKYGELLFELKNQTFYDNEDVWLIMMDFDEVMFTMIWKTVREFLNFTKQSDVNYNYYASKLIELYSPTENLDECFVHGTNGMRATYWPYFGTKVSMIKVNDFKFENCFLGHGLHTMKLIPEENVSVNNLNDIGLLFSFHLKHLTKEIYEYKMNCWISRKNDNTDCEKNDDDGIGFRKKISTSFPLEQYFLMIGLDKYKSFYNKNMGVSFGDLTIK